MGALLARGDAAAGFHPGDHASTFGGGPFVASVAATVLDVILAEGFLEGVRRRGAQLGEGLGEIVRAHDLAVEARGRGLMWGLRLAAPRAGDVARELMDAGLLTVPAGPDVVRFVPPLIVSEEEVARALAAVGRALRALEEVPSAETTEGRC